MDNTTPFEKLDFLGKLEAQTEYAGGRGIMQRWSTHIITAYVPEEVTLWKLEHVKDECDKFRILSNNFPLAYLADGSKICKIESENKKFFLTVFAKAFSVCAGVNKDSRWMNKTMTFLFQAYQIFHDDVPNFFLTTSIEEAVQWIREEMEFGPAAILKKMKENDFLILWYWIQEIPYKEAASKMGMTEGTFTQRLRHLLKAFKNPTRVSLYGIFYYAYRAGAPFPEFKDLLNKDFLALHFDAEHIKKELKFKE